MAVAEVLESYVRGSIAVVVHTSLNVCNEVVKFILILLILFYFTLWSFQFLEDVLQTIPDPDKPSFKSKNKDFKKDSDIDLEAIQFGDTRLRQPDENPSLLQQLEIEAEFEENMKKLGKKEEDVTIKPKDSNDFPSAKDLLDSQVKRQSNETNRASQTNKTSLGKKLKLRESEPTTSKVHSDEEEDKKLDTLTKKDTSDIKDDEFKKTDTASSPVNKQFEDVSQALQDPDKSAFKSEDKDFKKDLDIDLEENQLGDKCIRIGKPDENLLKQTPSLFQQLETEAEFEENIEKLVKEEDDTIKTRDRNDFPSAKDLFIAQIKRESNEISRASQTIKTSLGKKSKVRKNKPTTSKGHSYEEEDEKLLDKLIKKDISDIKDGAPSYDEFKTSETTSSPVRKDVPSYDEEYSHESFHRA